MNYVVINGAKFISTVRAAVIADYAKDYVGQLCRDGKLECKRVSGHWYVKEESLTSYIGVDSSVQVEKNKTHIADVATKHTTIGNIAEDAFSFNGVAYVATASAAESTGYTQDYIGQLARSGDIAARKVGRRWFIGKESLLAHKKQNDELLAEVQTKASGVRQTTEQRDAIHSRQHLLTHHEITPGDVHFNVRYVSESDNALVPTIENKENIDSIREPKKEYPASDIYTQKNQSVHMIDTRNMLETNKMVASRKLQGVNIIDLHQQSTQESEKTQEKYTEEVQELFEYDEYDPLKTRRGWFGRILKLTGIVVVLGVIIGSVIVITRGTSVISSYIPFKSSIIIQFIPKLLDKYTTIIPGTTIEYRSGQ